MQSTALNLSVFMVLAMMAYLIRFSREARPKLFHKSKSLTVKSHKIGNHS